MRRRIMPARIWDRGKKLFANGKVKIENIDKGNREVVATVYGTYAYEVHVNQGDPSKDSCTCSYFPDNGFCKHIAAVVEYFKSAGQPIETLFDDPQKVEPTDTQTLKKTPVISFPEIKMVNKKKSQADLRGERFFKNLDLPQPQYYKRLSEVPLVDLDLEVTLIAGTVTKGWNYAAENRLFLRFHIANKLEQKFYVVNDLDRFLKAYQSQGVFKTTSNISFLLDKHAFSKPDRALLDLMMTTGSANFDGNSSLDLKKFFLLEASLVPDFLKHLQELPHFHFQQGEKSAVFDEISYQPFRPEDGLIQGKLIQDDDGYQLTIHSGFQISIPSSALIVNQNEIYQTSTNQMIMIDHVISRYQAIMQPSGIADETPGEMHFGWGSEAQLNKFVAAFKQIGVLELPADFITTQMTPHFDLRRKNTKLQLQLSYDYNGKLFDSNEIQQVSQSLRNLEKEDQTQDYLSHLKFSLQNGLWEKTFKDPDVLYAFFTRELPNLRKNGVVTVSEDLQSLWHDSKDLNPEVSVSEKAGLLSVKFSLKGVDEDDVDAVLGQLDLQRPYITQPDGSLVLVDDAFRKVSQALVNIRQQGKFKHGELKVHASQAFAVQAALQGTAKFDEKFKQLAENLAHPENYPIAQSHPIHGSLRPYQTIGVKWLEMLDSYHFGGILADEMGLGKTVQMIAFLLDHLDPEKPNLIVSPASLIYNWQEEFNKFAPEITAQVIDGNKAHRASLIAKKDADVLITSYNSARLDVSAYNARKINYLVLDEAQFVKNSSTKTNQSIRNLQRKNAFALSGTPIENRVEELWAIFEIVMPGLLPSKKAFKKLTAAEVAVRVKPFILRREKAVVLKDIPAKVEANLYNELTQKQKTVYLAQLKQMQVKVQGMTGANFVKNKLAILAGLTRLRQICDTPALYLKDYKGDSGKLEQLTEILRQAEENNRHVLIFSQFTGMLAIIEKELQKQHLAHYVLEGNTKPKERLKMVNAFNANERNIFLISLKAGGTGLNLTGADMVVLVDLWWNPAVEDQATARAHRIGQKKQVDVFRLITKGTIEEQIYKLQEKKRNFVDQVLNGTENKGSLTEEEVRLILGIETK